MTDKSNSADMFHYNNVGRVESETKEYMSHDFIKPNLRTGKMNCGDRCWNNSHFGGEADGEGVQGTLLGDGPPYFLKVRITCVCVSLLNYIKSVHFIFSASSTLEYSVFRQIPIIAHRVCSFPASSYFLLWNSLKA